MIYAACVIVYLFGIGFAEPICVKIGWDYESDSSLPPAILYACVWPLCLAFGIVQLPFILGNKMSAYFFSNKNKPTTF